MRCFVDGWGRQRVGDITYTLNFHFTPIIIITQSYIVIISSHIFIIHLLPLTYYQSHIHPYTLPPLPQSCTHPSIIRTLSHNHTSITPIIIITQTRLITHPSSISIFHFNHEAITTSSNCKIIPDSPTHHKEE